MKLAVTFNHPLKTALAAALSMAAYRALHLPHGYWAPISAIIVMQSNLGRSIHASSNRLLGTVAGASVATLVLWLGGSNELTLAIAVGLTVWLLTVVKMPDAMRLGGVTAAIVMLISEGSAWRTGLSRFLDVVLGVVIALAVSVAWPSRARTQLRESLAQTFAELSDLFTLAIACSVGRDCDVAKIEAARTRSIDRSRRNSDLVRDVRREPTPGGVLLLLADSAERIRGHLFAIDNAARLTQNDSLHRALRPEMEALLAALSHQLELVRQDLSRRTNHTKPVDLDGPLNRLEERFAVLRSTGATLERDADEMLRLYALLYRLRQLAPELQRSAEFANAVVS